jgi:hypothetical protein
VVVARYEQLLTVALPLSDTVLVCNQAVANSGFTIKEQRADGLKCVEQRIGNYGATLNIVCNQRDSSTTVVSIEGSRFTLGPALKTRAQVMKLSNLIEVCAAQHE